MMKRKLSATCLVSALLIALVGGASGAQQLSAVDIRQLVPPNSVLAVAFDLRPDNPSMPGPREG